MRKFLHQTAVFSLIITVILVIGELVVRNLPTSYSYKDNWLRENGNEVSTLVLGSSHTYYGLRPEILGDSTFNLANISQTPEYDLALLKHYLPMMPNLRRIVIPISYFTFRDPEIEKGDEWMLANKYKIHMHLPMHSDFSIYNLEITDFDSYKGKLKNLILKDPSNICDSLGFGLGFNLHARNPQWKEIGPSRAAKHTVSTPGRHMEAMATINTTIKTAKRHGAEVVFITTPACSTYLDALDHSQLAEMYDGIARIVKDNHVEYYDFLKDKRFSDSDFYDPDHLSDVGAEKLSQILADTLSIMNPRDR
ncbi:MAG: hypothetical protein K2J58_06075 [Muribaculaceae bacterium]|nr:hypothetical protein [Muribaculaceae bacterium]